MQLNEQGITGLITYVIGDGIDSRDAAIGLTERFVEADKVLAQRYWTVAQRNKFSDLCRDIYRLNHYGE